MYKNPQPATRTHDTAPRNPQGPRHGQKKNYHAYVLPGPTLVCHLNDGLWPPSGNNRRLLYCAAAAWRVQRPGVGPGRGLEIVTLSIFPVKPTRDVCQA